MGTSISSRTAAGGSVPGPYGPSWRKQEKTGLRKRCRFLPRSASHLPTCCQAAIQRKWYCSVWDWLGEDQRTQPEQELRVRIAARLLVRKPLLEVGWMLAPAVPSRSMGFGTNRTLHSGGWALHRCESCQLVHRPCLYQVSESLNHGRHGHGPQTMRGMDPQVKFHPSRSLHMPASHTAFGSWTGRATVEGPQGQALLSQLMVASRSACCLRQPWQSAR